MSVLGHILSNWTADLQKERNLGVLPPPALRQVKSALSASLLDRSSSKRALALSRKFHLGAYFFST